MKTCHRNRGFRAAGFTLIELLVVVAIMGLLAAMTIMGFRYANVSAKRNLTSGFQRAIEAGLERYMTDNGEYPEPKNTQMPQEFNGKNYNTGGAMMLYQALSGDGNNAINIASGGGRASDGQWSNIEIPEQKMTDMPKEMWMRIGSNFIIVDGFKRPYQYQKAPRPTRTNGVVSQTSNNETINNTYDLYSFSDDDNFTPNVTLSMKRNPAVCAKWIRNW